MAKQTILNYESSAATALNGASAKGSPFNSPEWHEFSANADKKHAAAVEAAKPVMEKLRRKHHARSTELAPVVGVYEDAPAAIPPVPKPEDFGWEDADPLGGNGGGGWQIEGGEEAYYEALDKAFSRPQGPIIVPRNNVPNRYDREALEDFIEDPDRLNRAQEHFLRLTQNGMTEKTAFRLMLMTYCDE